MCWGHKWTCLVWSWGSQATPCLGPDWLLRGQGSKGAGKEEEDAFNGENKMSPPHHQVPSLHFSSSLSHPCWQENSSGHHPPCRTKVLGSFTSCLCDLQKITVNLRVDLGEEKCSLQTQAWHSPPEVTMCSCSVWKTTGGTKSSHFRAPSSFCSTWLCSSELRNSSLATTRLLEKVVVTADLSRH